MGNKITLLFTLLFSFGCDPEMQPGEYEEELIYELPDLKLSQDIEAHYIGVYETASEDSGVVRVVVDRPGKPMMLVLSSYESVEFALDIRDGSIVELVVLSGYEPSKVTGISQMTPVLFSSGEEGVYAGDGELKKSIFPFFFPLTDDSEQTYALEYVDDEWACVDREENGAEVYYPKLERLVKEIIDGSTTTEQASYRPEEGHFKINAETSGKLMPKRENGYCYKNDDGSLVLHESIE